MYRQTLFLFFCMLAAVSCNRDNNNYSVPLAYTGGYTLKLTESWDGRLKLIVVSNKIFDCTNYGVAITNTFDADNKKVELTISGIQTPASCKTGSAGASDTVDIGILDLSTYSINITNENKSVIGSIVVTNNEYTINYAGGNNVTIVANTINRVPENTLWGTAEFADASFRPVVDTFLDSLEFYGAKAFTGPLVEYSLFSAHSGNTFSQDGDGGRTRPYKHFIYFFNSSNANLTRLMRSYQRYGDDVKISMTTDNLFYGTHATW